jgi:Zn-dependent protease with chaperone function
VTWVYRETYELRAPAELVAGVLEDQFGTPLTDGHAKTWSTSQGWGLYDYDVRLDLSAGKVTTTISISEWFPILALSSLLALVLVLTTPVPPSVHLGLIWTYGAVAFVPVAHLWPGVTKSPSLGDRATAVSRELTPYAAPAYVTVVGLQWAALRPVNPDPVVDVLSVVLLLVGGGIYYNSHQFGDVAPEITALSIPLSGLLPPLISAGNLVIARTVLTNPDTNWIGVGLLLACSLSFTVAFVVYCQTALRSFAQARFAPLGSPLTRTIGLVLYLGLNAVLLASIGLAVGFLATGLITDPTTAAGQEVALAYETLDTAFQPLPFFRSRAYSIGFYVVLLYPLLTLGFAWLYYVVTGLASRLIIFYQAEELSVAEFPIDLRYTVYVTDRDDLLARPMSFGFGLYQAIVVGSTVVDHLDENELAAVLAHESYHLRNRDLVVSSLATFASFAFGGRNGLLAFYDYPRIERAADTYASEVVSASAMVRALRRLEALRDDESFPLAGALVSEAAVEKPRPGETVLLTSSILTNLRLYVTAPYRLLFGSVLLQRAHGSVDERIARLLENSATDRPDDE